MLPVLHFMRTTLYEHLSNLFFGTFLMVDELVKILGLRQIDILHPTVVLYFFNVSYCHWWYLVRVNPQQHYCMLQQCKSLSVCGICGKSSTSCKLYGWKNAWSCSFFFLWSLKIDISICSVLRTSQSQASFHHSSW